MFFSITTGPISANFQLQGEIVLGTLLKYVFFLSKTTFATFNQTCHKAFLWDGNSCLWLKEFFFSRGDKRQSENTSMTFKNILY